MNLSSPAQHRFQLGQLPATQPASRRGSATRRRADPRARRCSRRAPRVTRNPARSRRRVIWGTESVRNTSENVAGGACPAAPFDVLLIENREAARAILPDRLHERDARRAAPPRSAESHLVAVLLPDRQVRHEIQTEDPARASARGATDASVAVQIGFADERLQNAVGRHHQIEARRLPKRQRADIGPQPATRGPSSRARLARRRAWREHLRRAIDADDARARARDRESSTRPVPHPSSSTGPSARRAISCQKRTSRRSSVCAFSQS